MSVRNILLACLFATSISPATASVNPRPYTIPAIHNWEGREGFFKLTPQSRIIYTDAHLRTAAEMLAADMKTLTDVQMTVTSGKKADAGDILFTYKAQKVLGDEGYTIDIAKNVRIAAMERGANHAVQTLLQMLQGQTASPLSSTMNFGFPCGIITDRPDYRLRGLMLDCGRKYFPLDYMRRLVRTMAYYKMNTLSVHLNDNIHCKFSHNNWDETYAAFRMESERFPGLTAEDGSYGKAEFRQFILEAAELGVEVIPEIDVPAHSLAFSHYRHSLGSEEFGMDHLELTNPEVIPFVDSIFAEYLEGPEPIFAGPRVHIGTDEYNNKKQDIVERFRALTDHMIHTVESYGKQAALWGSLTHARGTTPVKVDNVLMFAWYNGYAQPDSMRALGYQLVSIPSRTHYIVPAAGYYYDYLNSHNLYDNWTPAVIAQARFEERDPHIEGGMFAVWNDIVGNGIAVADIHHRVMPAIQVVAEKCWSADTLRTYEEWQHLANSLGEAPGINDLGRYPKGVVLEAGQVTAGSSRNIPFIGWPYRVSFDIEAAAEERGTALFRNDDAEFYLADPASGRLGFIRDGYLFNFRHALRSGAREHIAVEGTNRETRLYVNGKLVETLGPDKRFFAKDNEFNIIRTLRFPLQRTDANLHSQVTNLRVESLAPDTH
ncbi:MAG: family 20 glycosylhydrolase [Bacteroidaceae bacterium]|nr:family 20 glycosylhydrolase [Bacteroidaceae bacterium]